jgi:hypothetical protein
LWAHRDETGSLLDLGGGQGAYSAAWLARGDGQTATLVDRAPVCALARRALGCDPRLAIVEGDFLDDTIDVGHTYAVALLANVLHLLDENRARRAVARAATHVAPGGVVIVKDLLIDPDRTRPRVALYFSLVMAMYADGTVYDPDTIRGWLRAADLRDITVEPAPAAPDSIIVWGRRQ